MRTSILGTFFLASPAEMQEGIRWYQDALQVAVRIASSYSVSSAQAAAVIAALSPQNPWERNIIDADNLIALYTAAGKDAAQAYKCGTFGRNKQKAIQCLEVTETHQHDEILNGKKVVAFYHCIFGDPDYVCVDGHAYSIWLGERVSTANTPKITPKLYEIIAQDYKDSTDKINQIAGLNLLPFQVQAITWVVHRNLYKSQRRLRKAA